MHEYLVTHGLGDTPGRFRADGLELARGDRVVVRAGRGAELGEVLRRGRPTATPLSPVVGDVLRRAAEADLDAARRRRDQAAAVLAWGDERVIGGRYPVVLLDAEVLLDGEEGTLVYVRTAEWDARELVAPLSREFDLHLQLLDLTVSHGTGGCGTGGCGTGGCGTSCGSATTDEVRSYFAELREAFERQRVSLL